MASGKSPRGIKHMCIYKNGQLVHDPYPTKEGLKTFEDFQTLEPLNYKLNQIIELAKNTDNA